MNFGQEQQPANRTPVKLQLPPGFWKKVVFGIVIAVVVLAGSTMVYTVQEQQKAAILTFGKYSETKEAGLHFKWPYPIQEVIKVEANRRQVIHIGYQNDNGRDVVVPEEALMITGDENIVSADAVVEWIISDIPKYLYNIDQPEVFLKNAAIASIRSVMGSTKLDFAITDGKTEIQGLAKEKLIELQELYDTGIQVLDLKFQDIEPPEGEVATAFKEVTNAREEKNTKVNNANKYKNDRLPKARGEAQAMIEGAEAEKQSRILNAQGDVAKFNAIYQEYAKNPRVTEDRLILETLEQILPNAKIFITDGQGDTVKYLPINEVMNPRASSTTQGGSAQ